MSCHLYFETLAHADSPATTPIEKYWPFEALSRRIVCDEASAANIHCFLLFFFLYFFFFWGAWRLDTQLAASMKSYRCPE